MREALGNYYSLVIVFMAFIIISGFIAFNTNYNKAFKMKNRIITILEKYDNNPSNEEAKEEIRKYAKSIGYNASTEYTSGCTSADYTIDSNNTGWCYKVNTSSSDKTNGSVKEYVSTYVDVRTFVSIDIPIFNVLFSHINFFAVNGSTKKITKLKD